MKMFDLQFYFQPNRNKIEYNIKNPINVQFYPGLSQLLRKRQGKSKNDFPNTPTFATKDIFITYHGYDNIFDVIR